MRSMVLQELKPELNSDRRAIETTILDIGDIVMFSLSNTSYPGDFVNIIWLQPTMHIVIIMIMFYDHHLQERITKNK